jgi:hypothetical protein
MPDQKKKMPHCIRCQGANWVDLGRIPTIQDDLIVDENEFMHLYQCGGGEAHIDPNDIKNGCMRVIRATPKEMETHREI